MTTVDEMRKLHDANMARAAEFAERFSTIKVTSCGVESPNAMAVHYNPETGWGFTVQFITTPDFANHIKAWTEFVGKDGDQDAVAEQLKKIVGA